MLRFFAAIALVIGMALGVYAQESKTADFIRYQPSDDGTGGLQIAVTDYVSSSSGTTVTLYGVVHIADESYYQKVQKDLDTYDAVLYEGVGGDKMKQMKEHPPKEKPMLSVIQHLAGDVLDLKFQLDSIDYTRKNLVHADIPSMEGLKEKMKGESVLPFGNYIKEDQLQSMGPLLEQIGPVLKNLLKTFPDIQNGFKDKLGHQLAESDITAQLSPDLYKAIVLDRNQIVMDKINDQLKNHADHKTIAVFYGAAHMPDLEKRLAEMGFKQSNKRWATAWSVKPVAEDDSDGEPAEKPESHQGKRLDDRQKNIDPKDDDEDK